MKKRLLASLMTICLLVGLLPTAALATEGEPGGEMLCTCTALCTEEDTNETCEVCAAGYTACTYTAPVEQIEGPTGPEAPACTELTGCTEGSHDAKCPLYVAPVVPTEEPVEENKIIAPAPLAEDGMSGSCGAAENDNVTWALTQNNSDSSNPTYTLTISGSGKMKNYAKNSNAVTDDKPIYTSAPWRTSGVLSTVAIDVDGTAYDGTYLTGITKIVVGDGVTRIGSSAFSYMRDVTEITIANSVTSIGDRAFMYNCSLKTISIPDSVQMNNLATNNQDADGELLLGHCYNLKNVTLGNGFTVIPCRAFENTEIKPSEITMDESKITGIGQQAFFQTAGVFSVDELDLTSFTALKTIATNAFSNWSIQSLKLPSALEKIGSFNTVSNLATVNWTDLTSLTEIEGSAFKSTKLTSADLSNTKVSTIGWGAFNGCSALTTVVLPSTITSIGTDAFSGMADGSTITVPEDKYTLLSGKYTPEKTTIITLGSTIPDTEKTIGLVHNGSTTYFSSFSSAANNAVSGDTIFATQSYTFANGEVALVKTGVSLTGGNLDGYGATYENDEITAYCDTLQTALVNCADGDTVKLNAEVSVSANMSITKNITIDLNQKTVTSSVFAAPLLVKSNVTCTITNGTIQNTCSNYGICVDTENGSTTTLSNLTLTNSNKTGSSPSSIRVKSCTVVLSGVNMSNQQLFTVTTTGQNTPTVFFTGSNTVETSVIDANGTWSLYFDSSATNVLTSNKANAIRYFLNCSYSDLSSIDPVNRENKTLTWYDNEQLNGTAVSTPAENSAYYAKWDNCNHETKSYSADNSALTQTCATCDRVLGTATLAAPTNLTYDGSAKEAAVTTTDGWLGDAPTPAYYRSNEKLDSAPTAAGTYTAKITAGEGDITASVEFEIIKAQPTISLSASPETLTGSGTVTLTVSGLPDGTIAAPVCDGVTVTANSDGTYSATLPNETKEYTFTVNYAGSDNHEAAAATCTVSVTRRSSGGGGGSSSGNTTTETTTNSDGSKTTTVTDKKTGTVTETTKFKDGSTLVVETKKDGTVTTTETAANDVKVKTVDEPGEDVTAAVTIPRSVGTATVTIPADVDYGMVAVDSKTGEIVKLSVPTEDGMTVKLDGSANLVLEDRSKDFTDTNSHWAEDAIDFATAHELFSGTSDTTFTPDSPMTRAMLMTVLARFDGQDTTGGAVWYETSMSWAKENGISDGTNPNGSISREQLATMLWRYVGSPAGDGSAIGRFTDSGKVNSYAVEAMNWAVGTGLFGGMGDGTLAPQGSATRAQVATILMRFVENLTK